MSEERADEPFAVQEIHMDGFSGVHVYEQSIRGTAFSVQDGHPVAVVRFIISERTARNLIAQITEALNEKAASVRLVRSRRKPG
jgi:hypothetical protein